ncbi:MAG: rod shape-determining protein MreB [Armatimonadota bacterium]
MDFTRFFRPWTPDLAIDLGTANTLIHMRGRGILLREPSVVAIEKASGEIRAVGDEAKRMLGRTPAAIETIRPLRDGVIADYDIAGHMLAHFVEKVYRRRPFIHPNMLIGVPSGVTEVECLAVKDAARRAGAKQAWVIEEPIAAAIGAGLPIHEATGSMVVDIGGGTTEVAIISLGDVVLAQSIRIGGDEIDEAIIAYARREFNLQIGERTSEAVKLAIGSVWPLQRELEYLVRGRDLVTGLPAQVTLTSGTLREAIGEPVLAVLDVVKLALEQTPPELSSDIMERGIALTGGGALLRGMDRLVQHTTGMPAYIVDDPLSCVVLGAARVLAEGDLGLRTAFERKLAQITE